MTTVGVLLAARRSPVPGRLAAPTPLGRAAPADVYFSFDHKRCWRRGVVSFCLRHLVAWRSSLAGARVYGFLLHMSSSLVVAPSSWFSRCTGWCGGLMPLQTHAWAMLSRSDELRIRGRTGLSGPAGGWLSTGPGGFRLGPGLVPELGDWELGTKVGI